MRVELLSESELHYRLLSHLAKERDLMSGQIKNPSQFHYQGMPDFVLREGQFFKPRPLPAGINYLEIRQCYENAFRTALEETFVYVEGYSRVSAQGYRISRESYTLALGRCSGGSPSRGLRFSVCWKKHVVSWPGITFSTRPGS